MKKIVILLFFFCSTQCFAQTKTTDTTVIYHKLSKEDIKHIVLHETKPGGKMDFFTSIKDKENEAAEIKPGTGCTRLAFALYKWGEMNAGIEGNSLENALVFYSLFKGRELYDNEKNYIKSGYNKEFDK